jgi:DNA-binding CsgD family transcriptional regulator
MACSRELLTWQGKARAQDGQSKAWLNGASAPQSGMCALAHLNHNSICTLYSRVDWRVGRVGKDPISDPPSARPKRTRALPHSRLAPFAQWSVHDRQQPRGGRATVAAGRRWLPEELVAPAIRRAAERRERDVPLERVLTAREYEIARAVAEGLSNKQIARALGISEGTVKIHLHNVS